MKFVYFFLILACFISLAGFIVFGLLLSPENTDDVSDSNRFINVPADQLSDDELDFDF
jgi:hypothetical protein